MRRPFLRALSAAVLCASGTMAHAAVLQPHLKQMLASARATDSFEVIVTFKDAGAPSRSVLAPLEQLGVRGYHFEALPMAGVVATKAQIAQILKMPSVRSVWNNEPLRHLNAESRRISSVDLAQSDPALRNGSGLPFTGRGIGVLINDSGIDGTHADLSFPDHVVQNVLGHTNLAAYNEFVAGVPPAGLLPTTYTQNVANSDLLGSHGTHVAGIVGASGAMSGGKYRGVAPGANLVGYGSGATIAVLDALGGYDYALTHKYHYNIRIINNSFGCASCSDTALDPASPEVIATKMLADNDIIPVFAAGNDGPGATTIKDGYKKAPWVFVVAAGTKDGKLADFSSRGTPGYQPQTFTMDGETFKTEDQPLVTAPGVSVVSTRAKSADGVGPVYGGGVIFDTLAVALDNTLEPQYAPFYTHDSGTSMASPHLAGIIALMLEANPSLKWKQVRYILKATATSMPGMAPWEVGAGYVNAHAAVAMALRLRGDYGSVSKTTRGYLARPLAAGGGGSSGKTLQFTLHYDPVDGGAEGSFEVGDDISSITASADSGTVDGFVAADLIEPNGTAHYGGCLADCATATAYPNTVAAKPGTWKVRVSGALIGGPEGGRAADVPVTVVLTPVGGGTSTTGYSGLDDVAGHPLQAQIESAIASRCMDTRLTGFMPDAPLTRIELAQYLTLCPGLRLELPLDRQPRFTDVLDPARRRYAEVATTVGTPLKALGYTAAAPMSAVEPGLFKPQLAADRLTVAVALVQALGLGDVAAAHTGAVRTTAGDEVTDLAGYDDATRGYFQQAINLGLFTPELIAGTAYVYPTRAVSRAEYAVAALQVVAAYGPKAPPDYIDTTILTSVCNKVPVVQPGQPIPALPQVCQVLLAP